MSVYRDKEKGRFRFEFIRVIDGKRIRVRKLLPKTWTQAQADAFDRAESARLYAIATRVERHQHTIEDAVQVYLEERVPHLKSAENIARELAQTYWAYKGKPITDLHNACREYAKKARKDNGEPLSPATVRNRIRYLTSACRYAWKHHGMCDRDPADRVVVPSVQNERRHFISRREMVTLARACRGRAARAAIRIAFYSGMRIAEIVRARRVDGTFILDDSKNGMPRHIPIHPKVRGAANIPMPTPDHITRRFRAAREAVGMEWLHFHDLRHSAASQMINSGVDLYTVGAVLGHKSAQSTKRYAHLATDSLRGAIAMIGKKVA